MQNRVFLDTSFAIALSVKSDENHSLALQFAQQLEEENTRIITTTPILLELGNALSKRRHRPAAVELLRSLDEDETVEIVALDDELFSAAFRLFSERDDKDWGLIDCISFVVMKTYGISEALTADEHFEQAGFVALLKK